MDFSLYHSPTTGAIETTNTGNLTNSKNLSDYFEYMINNQKR
jgi:hypothetical protein